MGAARVGCVGITPPVSPPQPQLPSEQSDTQGSLSPASLKSCRLRGRNPAWLRRDSPAHLLMCLGFLQVCHGWKEEGQ